MTAEIEKPKFTLMEIESALSELLTARAEAEEMPEAEREQALAAVDDALAEYVSREVQKADSIIGFCRNLKRAMEAAKEDRDYYAKRAEFLKRTLDRVKDLTHTAMEFVGKKRIDGRNGYLMLKGNGGVEPLTIDDPAMIPDEFKVVRVTMSAKDFNRLRPIIAKMAITIPAIDAEVSQSRIREALAQPCWNCGGEGTMPDAFDGVGPCAVCDGSGKNTVPGAHLEPRGSHVEIR